MCCNNDLNDELNCCHPENPLTDKKRICCDCNGKCCGRFDEECRDCFWPDFTHPKWLCCRILYGCCPHRQDHDDDDDRDDKHCKCHCKCSCKD